MQVLAVAALLLVQDPPKPDPAPKEKSLEERVQALEKNFLAPDSLRVNWKDGLRITSPEQGLDLRIGGRMHYEMQVNQADDDLEATRRYALNSGDTTSANSTAGIGPLEDGAEMRRARIQLAGTFYGHFEFKWQYDFSKGSVGQKDVYGGFLNLGDWVPNIRVGHQFEPFGLESITSSNDHLFIERSAPSLAIGPARNPGILLWKNLKVENEERVTWAAGVFREDSSDNAVSAADGAWNVTARVTGTPFWQEKGKRMLHLGLAATRREVPGRGTEGVTYATKPEVDLFNTFLSTGAMREADTDWRYCAETAFQWNAIVLQGEYMLTKTDMNSASALDDPSFNGWYVQAGWTLTGEPRRWKPAEATYQNAKPSKNAFQDGGMGSWELAVRYSSLDLTDGNIATGGVTGGQFDAITVGLNWMLNPNVKLMWDVSQIDLDTDDPALGKGGDAIVGQMRVQFAF